MEFNTIILEKKEGRATISLNRPQVLNCFRTEMWLEIEEAIDDIRSDDSVRVVVITDKGKAFSVGADLKEVKTKAGEIQPMREYFRLVHRVLNAIENLTKPVITAVNGFALAGGFEVLLACDIVIASEDARLGEQHAHYALVPAGGGGYTIPRELRG